MADGLGTGGETLGIHHKEPLAAGRGPSTRWAAPYLSDTTGWWKVLTRRPLTQREISDGLSSYLTACTLEELRVEMAREDAKAEGVAEPPDDVPAWAHRA